MGARGALYAGSGTPIASLARCPAGADYKGKMALTKAGKVLAQQPVALWAVLTNYFLCEFDHAAYTRFDDRLRGNWVVFLNILNIDAQTGISQDRFASLVTGLTEDGLKLDYHFRPLVYMHVLRPLVWVGLREEHRGDTERLFIKTQLWQAAWKLESQDFLTPTKRH